MSIVLWVIIAIIGVIIDVITSAFLFVWFSFGAIGAMIAENIGLSFGMQLTIFILITIIAFGIGYPLAKKKFKINKKKIKTMEENYIGEIIIATKDIKEGDTNARIKISGVYWSGINLGTNINKGEKIIIVGIKGSKFEIRGLKES